MAWVGKAMLRRHVIGPITKRSVQTYWRDAGAPGAKPNDTPPLDWNGDFGMSSAAAVRGSARQRASVARRARVMQVPGEEG